MLVKFINLMFYRRGRDVYLWRYDDEHTFDALRSIDRFASNPELSFTWYDAAVVSQRILAMRRVCG